MRHDDHTHDHNQSVYTIECEDHLEFGAACCVYYTSLSLLQVWQNSASATNGGEHSQGTVVPQGVSSLALQGIAVAVLRSRLRRQIHHYTGGNRVWPRRRRAQLGFFSATRRGRCRQLLLLDAALVGKMQVHAAAGKTRVCCTRYSHNHIFIYLV